MLVYNYDSKTYLFTTAEDAYIDPEASKQQGERVYILPPNATFEKPPEKAGYAAKRENDTWVLIPDYRGQYCVNSDMVPQEIMEAGELEEGYALISAEQIALLQEKGTNYFVIVDGKLIVNPNYDKEREEKEQNRIAMLHMTKYDFYKHLCQPNNITYAQLMQIVNSSDEVAAAWNLCAYIYRGDETLITQIKKYLPQISDDTLTQIFEEYGV